MRKIYNYLIAVNLRVSKSRISRFKMAGILSILILTLLACSILGPATKQINTITPNQPLLSTQAPASTLPSPTSQTVNIELIPNNLQKSSPDNGWIDYSLDLAAIRNNYSESLQFIIYNKLYATPYGKNYLGLSLIMIDADNSYIKTQEGINYPATINNLEELDRIFIPQKFLVAIPQEFVFHTSSATIQYSFKVPEKLTPTKLVISPGIAFISESELEKNPNNPILPTYSEFSININENESIPQYPNANLDSCQQQSHDISLEDKVIAHLPGDLSTEIAKDGNNNEYLLVSLSIPITNQDITQDRNATSIILAVDQYGYPSSGSFNDTYGPGQSGISTAKFAFPKGSALDPGDFYFNFLLGNHEECYHLKLPNLNLPPNATELPSLGIGSMWTRPVDGMDMLYIPAGDFIMGNNFTDEKPVHTVTLDAYWIDKTQVTNAMFETFVNQTNYQTDAEKSGSSMVFNIASEKFESIQGANWKHPQGPNSSFSNLTEHPVVDVSWNDALAYCSWVGARLPSEAEWEKAARGKDGRTYPWGNQAPAGNLTNIADVNLPVSWAIKNVNDGYEFTAPVGSYPAGNSPYGVMDMAGNVLQWVNDWYSETYYSQSPSSNPQGPSDGQVRMIKGGSWAWPGSISAGRIEDNPDSSSTHLGFRCARSSP